MSKKAVSGIVFDIQRFSIHDGPGIRTTVFLKGCPLHCIWCHNPESISPDIEPDLKTPGKYFGRRITVEEVMEPVLRDRAYYEKSGGGITLSGGEPMLQFEFTRALLTAARGEGLHTCLDTSGWGSAEQFSDLLPLVDLFHFDYKATNLEQHLEWTGVPLGPVVSNLWKLHEQGAGIVLRCPVIPGLNDTEEHFRGIAKLSGEMPNLQVDILPFHNMARDKWARVGKENPLPAIENLTTETKTDWQKCLLEFGCDPERFLLA